MHLVHRTWIPQEADGFVQYGQFYLWVETDSRVRHKRRVADRNLHPRHLAHAGLGAFLAEKLEIKLSWGVDINRVERLAQFLLPAWTTLPCRPPSFCPTSSRPF